MAALRFLFSLLMIPFSMLIAGAAMLAFLAQYLRPGQCQWCTLAGLALPGVLTICLLLVIYWIFQKSKWVFLPLGAILLNTGYLLSMWQVTFFPPDATGKNVLHIATYNVGKFKSGQHQPTQYPICEYLQENAADIVCFQEYWNNPHLNNDSLSRLLRLPYYTACYLPGSKDLGSAVFSKYPILRSERVPFAETQNDAIWADIQVGEKIFRIVSCHLQTTHFNLKRREWDRSVSQGGHFSQMKTALHHITEELKINSVLRARQADLLRTLIDTTPYPVVVCGDFNDTPASYTYHRVKGKLSDSFLSCGNGYGYTYRGLKQMLRIDFILYSFPFQCSSYAAPPVEWSDHKPVLSKLIW